MDGGETPGRAGGGANSRPGVKEEGTSKTRLTDRMASVMQIAAQRPQSMHSAWSITAELPLIEIAWRSHASRQRPQPEQRVLST